MAKKHTPLVVGNWKMNPKTIGEAKKLFLAIRKDVRKMPTATHVVVAPPFPYLAEIERLSPSKRIELAAQDMFHETHGAYTGEVSLPMLKSVGVTAAIIGHSERRALGDSDAEIATDVAAAIRNKVTAIVCVGEKKRDSHGNYFNVVEAQLMAVMSAVPKSKAKAFVVAYEPVWAIGTGNTATPEDVEEMKLFIEKVLADHFGRTTAKHIRILYGGSVNKQNVAELMEQTQVDGFLVGGASLRPAEFIEIVKLTNTYAHR